MHGVGKGRHCPHRDAGQKREDACGRHLTGIYQRQPFSRLTPRAASALPYLHNSFQQQRPHAPDRAPRRHETRGRTTAAQRGDATPYSAPNACTAPAARSSLTNNSPANSPPLGHGSPSWAAPTRRHTAALARQGRGCLRTRRARRRSCDRTQPATVADTGGRTSAETPPIGGDSATPQHAFPAPPARTSGSTSWAEHSPTPREHAETQRASQR